MNLRIIALAAAAAVAATSAHAAGTQQTAVANASATIVTPASMSATQDLAFGTIAKPTGSNGNSVTVGNTTGANVTPTIGGSGNAYVATANQAHAAVFHLAGSASTTYSIDSAVLTFGAGDTALSPSVSAPTGGTLNTSGVADVPVGGTINISSSTPATTYTGTLTVQATFQ